MKKFLLSAFAALACVATASADEVKYDFINNTYGMTRLSGTTQEYNPNPFTIEGEGAVTIDLNGNTRLWADGVRFYKGSSYSINVNGGELTKVVINYKNATAGKGFDFVEGQSGTYTLATAVGTWEGAASSISFSCNLTKSNVAISSIVVTYTGGTVDTRLDAGLEFSDEKVTAVLGQEFTAPDLIKATTAPVTFSSDKEAVATVDATTGAVTLVGAGTARITATAEANDAYKAGSASYLLTVEEADPENTIYKSKLGEDFTFENPEGLEVWKHDNTYGLKGAAFIDSKSNAAVAIAYSPVIDLSTKKDIQLVFKNAFNQYKDNNVMIDVAEFNGYAELVVREEGATEWTKLGEPTAPAKFSWNFYDNDPVSLDAYKGKKIQFGFKYISTDAVAGTWEVKDMFVTAVEDQTAIESVTIADENAPVEYFNLQGIRVNNPENGLYIRRQGNTVTKVLVK